MNIRIEPVQKVKPFEPFNIIIEVDDIEEARVLHKGFDDKQFKGFLETISIHVGVELTKQGFVYKTGRGDSPILTKKKPIDEEVNDDEEME